MIEFAKKSLVIACVLGLSGCATIVGGRYQRVDVNAASADPAVVGASCNLTNDRGSVQVSVPGTATVHRSSEALQVSCRKNGSQVTNQSFSSHLRGMVWGNILFGGVIGLIVDFSTGSARNYPEQLGLLANVSHPQSPATMTTAASDTAVEAAATQEAPAAGTPASLDSRVSVPMFRAAQEVASVQQCDRFIRVFSVDGPHAMFYTQCQAGQRDLRIECNGADCVPLVPTHS
jgi:hypothetical protein